MWCHSCQADVPAIDNLCDPGGESCVRCGAVLSLGDGETLPSKAIGSNPTTSIDDLWLADLDMARAKRRSHKLPLIADLKLNVLHEEPARVSSPQVIAANVSDRLHVKQAGTLKSQAIFVRTFAALVAVMICYGLATQHEPTTTIGLSLGSTLVLAHVIGWIIHPAPSATRHNLEHTTFAEIKRRAA